MSWLARSLVNSLKLNDDDDEDDYEQNKDNKNTESSPSPTDKNSTKEEEEDLNDQIDSSSDTPQGRGVKEDLSEITKTLTRQLWGVASFLAPPPPSSDSSSPPPPPVSSTDPSNSDWNQWDSSDKSVAEETSDSDRIAGIRNDFAEIGGKFKTGISKLSNNKAVTEISKIASNFLPFGSSEESNSEEKYSVGAAVGVTDEVLVFARNIAMHPDTWLDFPLSDDEDSDEFDMSDAQQEHALAVENLAPRLAALRMELCPGYMSEGHFWKIYFVMLHSRLSKHDAEVLSTPQIAEARASLMPDLPERTKAEPDNLGIGTYSPEDSANSPQEEDLSTCNVPTDTAVLETFASEPKRSVEITDIETEKRPIVSRDVPIIDKSIVEEPVLHKKDEVSGSPRKVVEEPVVQKKDEVGGSPRKVVEEPLVQKKDEMSGAPKQVVSPQTDVEDGDDWLEESTEMDSFSGTNIPIGNDEDVSFSDLEDDDDNDDKIVKSMKTGANHSAKDPHDWVQLSRNSDESS